MIINIFGDGWNPKDLVRSAVEDYIRFNRYVVDQLLCDSRTSYDCKAIADKIHDLEKLLATFDGRDEYAKAFSKEWDRTFDYRSLLKQEITNIERDLSYTKLDNKQRASKSQILEMLRRDIRQSEEDEAKYGHPLVDIAKQRFSSIIEFQQHDKSMQPIPVWEMIMPFEVEENELDLIIECISFVFVPYKLFQWESGITQLHKYAEIWLSSNSWKDGNDLSLLEGTLQEYLSIKEKR